MKKLLVMIMGLMLSAGTICFAQEATIVGTVTDPSGAAIPGAKVTVSNFDRGFVEHLTTNSAGAYVAASLPIGTYTISAEAAGFEKQVQSGVIVRVGAHFRVDLQLQVGAVTQQITVKQSTLHVQTETAELSGVVTGTQMQNLDLNGRDFASLALLVPGAAPEDSVDLSNPTKSHSVQVSFNGARTLMNNYVIDGTEDMDPGSFSGPPIVPNLDSVAEFRVATANYSAELGKLGSAQIQVVTKSGTKHFHGDAYDYFRNTALEANPWFQNRVIAPAGGNAPKAGLHWNDFGYTLGGPVYIPRHYNTDKSKTFFFWSQEFHRYRQPQVINAKVPSALMRQGDFSECAKSSGNYNPIVASGCKLPSLKGASYQTVQQMPGFSQQAFTNATDLLNAYVPLPNNGPVGYTHTSPFNTNLSEENIRVDQQFNDRTTAYVSWIHDADQRLDPTGGNGSTYDTIRQVIPAGGDLASIHLTRIFSPFFVNTAQVGLFYAHTTMRELAGSNSVTPSFTRPSDFIMNHLFAANDGDPSLPDVKMSSKGVPFKFTENTFVRHYNANLFDIIDNATLQRGHQSFKFGFYLDKYQKNEPLESSAFTNGELFFTGGGAVTTGNALADMFLGRIPQYTEAEVQTFKSGVGVPLGGYGAGYWRSTQFEPYLEDDWRVTPRLTLNLGVRYSYFVPQHDIQKPSIDDTFIPNLYNPAAQAQLDSNDNLIPGSGYNYTEYGNGLANCGVKGVPEGCTVLNKANVAPRFGFAYDPFGNGATVIRGGYGLFYSDTSESGSESMGGNPPSALSPTGSNIIGYSNIVPGALPPFSGFFFIPLKETMPTVQQWSFGVQHMFAANNLLTVSYVGTAGHHLTTLYNFNRVPIGVGTENAPGLAGTSGCDAQGNCDVQSVLISQNAPPDFFVPYRGFTMMAYNPLNANSNYNALQVEFRHSIGRGLMFQASYTWSHALDNSSSDGNAPGVGDPNLDRWYADSDYNRAQMLVFNYVYNLPFFAHSGNALVRQALGGWIISGVTSFYSGIPVNTFGVCGIDGYSNGVGENVQCNTVGPLRPKKGVFDDPEFGPTVTWFDPNAMAQPALAQLSANNAAGMFGYMGRNALTGPGRANWDMALLKNFVLPWRGGEHSTLQFRLEAFNAFNTPEWSGINFSCNGSPNSTGSDAFGRACGGAQYNLGNGEVTSTFAPREVELAAKFIF